MRLITLLVFLFAPTLLAAQNIAVDVARILELVPDIEAGNDSAVDETICLLAYYAAMPDRALVEKLADGPELTKYLRDNRPMREFLLRTGIAHQIEARRVLNPSRYLDSLFVQPRNLFLVAKTGTELFGPAGTVDLERIRQSVTAPETKDLNLATASSSAASRGDLTSPDALVSTALVGLSDFIAKRAQQELTYTFLERLREYLRKNDLEYLFPETAGYLPELDLLNYKAILPSIRRAFAQDLHAISYNLGRFLEARDLDGFSDPAVYNIFLVYRILDLDLRDVPLPDILAFTYGEINRSRTTVRSAIDLKFAEEEQDSPEYQALVSAFGAYAGAVQGLNNSFVESIDRVDDEINVYLDVMSEVDLTDAEASAYVSELIGLSTILSTQRMPLDRAATADNPEAITNSVVQAWLAGRESYDYYQAYPSLTKFDEFFGPDAEVFSAAKKRAAGLRAVRETLEREDLLDVYREQYTTLNQARVDLFNVTIAFSDEQVRKAYLNNPHELYRDSLAARIEAEMDVIPHPALALLMSLVEVTPEDELEAYAHLEAVEQRFERWQTANRPGSLSRRRQLEREERGLLELDELEQSIRATAKAYSDLREALITFNISRADGELYDAYQNLTTYESIFGIAQQSFFILAGSSDELFLDKEATSIFQTDANARQLFAGIANERMRKAARNSRLNTPAAVDFLLDFSLYLADYQASRIKGMEKTQFGADQKRRAAVEFITTTLESVVSAPIFRNPAYHVGTEEVPANLSLADRFPAFADVPAVSGEMRELFYLSQDGNYRYAIDNLLNLVEILDVYPDSSKKKLLLETKLDKLVQDRAELLGDINVEEPTDDLGNALSEVAAVADPGLILSSATPYTDTLPAVDPRALARLDRDIAQVRKKLSDFRPRTYQRFQENFFKYGTFMSDVVAAESPTDVETALNNIALPPGSSQIKRNRASSLELGAYFGASVASETLVLPADETDTSLEDAQTVVSLFVPVGLSYSRNLGGQRSATLFASVLDLGGITAFRLEQRNSGAEKAAVERLPEFSLRNVIAPGLHLMYNFPKSPFTLGIGVQDGPSVRKYTPAGSSETREARSVRFMVTGSVDVPIFRLGGE
ncbi:hypothetical protein [Lewinella sp. 4G2]|uniref:hypothetical protein n=1 Tax=Lewinella sp. 4G2 TaxID=1803372 RepID=UPI0007B47973|nr:hypothetical protein [Lewinella sp. 4G2]OAV43933.1 hypothetical protein A3850_005245 [Lewinella sp. 4G2]